MVYRKGVAAFILNNKKEFLMVLGAKKNNLEIDYWKIPAGGVKKNETSENGLKRELFEELGLEEKEYEIISKSKYKDKFDWSKKVSQRKYEQTGVFYNGQERDIFILKLKTDNFKFKLQKEEITAAKWFTKDNFKKYINIDNQKKTMQKIINEFKDYF
jgi:putative (di)nucleoside polyphosphate hydrolase